MSGTEAYRREDRERLTGAISSLGEGQVWLHPASYGFYKYQIINKQDKIDSGQKYRYRSLDFILKYSRPVLRVSIVFYFQERDWLSKKKRIYKSLRWF